MTITSQQLRELAGKATQGPWAYRPNEHDDWGIIKSPPMPVDGFEYELRCVLAQFRDPDALDDEVLSQHRKSGTDPWRGNAELVVALYNNIPTLLTALELQERLDKPETVEVVARALSVCDIFSDGEWEWWIDEAQAAIQALKGGAQ